MLEGEEGACAQPGIVDAGALNDGVGSRKVDKLKDAEAGLAFVAVLGKPETIGRAIQVTSDFVHSWNEATEILADALGVTNPRFLHIPAEAVLQSELGRQKELATAKLSDATFTNAGIRSIVPEWSAEISLARGLRQTIAWLFEDATRRRIDLQLNAVLEKLETEYDHF